MNPKYTTKREAREALAALDLVKHTTGVMYNVIYRLMVKTAADLLRHFYKGPRWMWLAGEWVQLEAKGDMLFVHNENGGLVLFDRDDIIDILDTIEAGQIYSHAGGGPYAPLRIDTETPQGGKT